MLRKAIAKLTVSVLLAVTILLPLKSTEVLAASMKYVTVDTYAIFNGTMNEIAAQVAEYQCDHPTYFYRSGKYEGTLNMTGVYVDSTGIIGPDRYTQTIRFRYSGYVTEVTYSKVVTQGIYLDFVSTSDSDVAYQVAAYVQNNPTMYYNDGTYSGYLNYSRYWLVYKYPNEDTVGYYNYRYAVQYSGTVTY